MIGIRSLSLKPFFFTGCVDIFPSLGRGAKSDGWSSLTTISDIFKILLNLFVLEMLENIYVGEISLKIFAGLWSFRLVHKPGALKNWEICLGALILAFI